MTEKMLDTLLSAVVTLAFTTIIGGIFGYFLQTRLWKNQWRVQKNADWQQESKAIFDEISRLMDRRIFRLNQFLHWTHRQEPERLVKSLEEYRDVVAQWNEAVNRNISLIQFYFGSDLRNAFDHSIGDRFVKAGRMVEKLYRQAEPISTEQVEAVQKQVTLLQAQVYAFNLEMLEKLRDQVDQAKPKGFWINLLQR